MQVSCKTAATRAIAAAVCVSMLGFPLHAQMVNGAKMPGYAEAFELHANPHVGMRQLSVETPSRKMADALPESEQLAQTQTFALRDSDRVVFYGDSITAQRRFPRIVESMVYSRYPNLKVRFFDAGNGGDKVSGGSAGTMETRVDRDLIARNPSVVVVMLGMNDGGYTKIDPGAALKAYQDGYRKLLRRIRASLPSVRLFLLRPSPYDEIAHAPADAVGYNKTLIQYGDFVAELGKENGATVIDANAPVLDEITRARAIGSLWGAHVVPDRVHPSDLGAWSIALAIVKAWNFDGLVSDVSIDAHALKARAVKSAVSGVVMKEGVLSWQELDASFPAPADVRDGSTGVLFASTALDSFNQEKLAVTGLPAHVYSLRIDDTVIGTFSADALQKGLNLAHEWTPMSGASCSADATAEERVWTDIIRFNVVNQGKQLFDQAGFLRDLEEWDENRLAFQRYKLIPKSHTYTLTPAE